MTKAVDRYCAQINKSLNCPRRLKKTFLRQLRNEAQFFCEAQGNVALQSLYDQFGAPEVVAEEFLAELNPAAVEKYANYRRKAWSMAAVTAALAAILAGILTIQNQKIQQRIDEDFVASVIYKEDLEENPLWTPFQDIIFWNTRK